MENNISKVIDSIDLKTAIAWTTIITLVIDIITRFIANTVPTMATNGLFQSIVIFCFYFILLKKILKANDKEQKLKFILLTGGTLSLISQLITLYDIYGVIHSWGMFASAAPAEEWGKYMQKVTYPKTILFSILGGGLIIYFFYLLSKYTYPELKHTIRFLGIWSIVCNWITSAIITFVIVFLSTEDTPINIESITKWNINIFWYIALFLLYNKVGKVTYEERMNQSL